MAAPTSNSTESGKEAKQEPASNQTGDLQGRDVAAISARKVTEKELSISEAALAACAKVAKK